MKRSKDQLIDCSIGKPLLPESPINFGNTLKTAANVNLLSCKNATPKRIHLLKNMPLKNNTQC
jgi:hypothetical protein